jgi:hypothetical protein
METLNIDLETLTPSQAWELMRLEQKTHGTIPYNTLLSDKFSDILAQSPENIVTTVVNGFTIETTDCFLRHYFRVVELDNKWRCYGYINTYNSELTWAPEYIDYEYNGTNFVFNTENLDLFVKVTRHS